MSGRSSAHASSVRFGAGPRSHPARDMAKAPTTPISQQLERLLNPAAGANAAAAPSASSSGSPPTSRMPSTMHPSASSSDLLPGGAADPSGALDNLFAAKFSFQFDNLQHILRYMLGELRSAKRDKSEVERVSQRLKDLEANGDSMTTLTQQAAVCRKHNTHVSGALGRIEDRMTKEGALASRRLGALEVRGDKVESQLAAHATQIESITQHVQSQAAQIQQLAQQKPSSDAGTSAASASSSAAIHNLTPLSSLPSAGLISSSSSKRDALEFEGMTSQISKFMLSHSTALALLQEKVAAMEDAEATAKRVAADWETKWNYIQNENRRLQTKVGHMEEALEIMKMNPTVVQPAATNNEATTTATAVSSMAPSTHVPTASLPMPAGSSSTATTATDIDIAVDLDPSRGLPALDAEPTVRGTGLSEADLSALQARLESTFSGRVEELKSQMEERWTTERELARDHRVQILASTQAAAESALEARSALQETKKAQEDALAAVAQATERASASVAGAALLQGMAPSDESAAGEGDVDAVPAFAGAEILRGSSPPSSKLRPVTRTGSVVAPPAGPAAASGERSAAGGRVAAPKILNISQHDFDRVRAMAELALRRTVQHSEILALAQGSAAGFEKGSLGASGSGGAGGSASSLGGGATALEVEKLRASQSNVSGRILHVEDKLDTLNALSLATRKQVSQLASDFANNPLVKSMSLRIFEQEVKFAEVADKVQLLAHLLAKGSLLAPPTAQPALGRSASQARKLQQQPQPAQQQQPLTTAQLPNRSLMSALSADEKAAAAQRDDLSDMDDGMDSRAQTAAGSTRTQNDRSLAPSSSAAGAVDAGSSYMDPVDSDAVALGMVMRGASAAASATTGAAGSSSAASAASLTKDLHVLGGLQEKLASAAALDAKLASIDVLEGKVEALLDMDIKERMSFLERRFTTELTFLRSHVNSKVDSSSLKILLDKIELENSYSAATLEAARATLAAAQEDVKHSKHAAHVSPTRGRAHSREHKASVDLTADGSHIEMGQSSGAAGIGSMARSTARDTRARVSAELDLKNRDRKARMAHLLSMLEKKADVGSIKQLEEFVRSIDRHLRGLMHAHSVQLRQLEARGLIEPMDHLKTTTSKSIGGGGGGAAAVTLSSGVGGSSGARGGISRTTVPGYDEPHQSGPARALKKRAAREGDYEDEDHEDEDHGGHDAERPPRTMSLLSSPKHSLPSHAASSESEEAARVGFHVSNATNDVAALQEQCEDLQRQIASLHGLLSRKADRTLDGSAPTSSSGPAVAGARGLGAVSDGSLIHVGTVPATLDGLVLNPALSLVDHPHVSRLISRVSRLEKDQTSLQGMVMYQSKQLRNHREWIAKHSREIGALKEWLQHTQGMQANNVAALATSAGTAAQPPSGSQSARDSAAPPSTVAALAAQSSYPSPAVFQLLRQAEQDILSLRRSLRQKVDFMDLGISHPHDASQSLAAGNYPHPTLEDLRRLLFYLTPQLQAGTMGGSGGSGGGGSITGYASSGHGGGGAESKVSMFTSKLPALDPHGGGHTHGPGAPETWKCIACDRAMDSINTRASGSGGARGGGASAPGVSRHAAMTSSLSSIAPAGGLVGANTRRLIAATNPNTLFANATSPRTQTAPQQQPQQQQQHASAGAAALTPRPPPAAPVAAKRAAATTTQADSSAVTAAPAGAPSTDAAAAAAAVAAAEKAARKAEKKRIRAEEKAAAARITLANARGAPTTAAPAPPPAAAAAAAPAPTAAPKPVYHSMHSMVEVAEAAVGASKSGELIVNSTTEHAAAAAREEKSEATP